jgi:hypothetical protein
MNKQMVIRGGQNDHGVFFFVFRKAFVESVQRRDHDRHLPLKMPAFHRDDRAATRQVDLQSAA